MKSVNLRRFAMMLPSVLLLTLQPIQFSSAAIVNAQGTAMVGDSALASARKIALQDAMRQAMLQAGSRIKTESHLDLHVLESDSVRIRAVGIVKEVVVLDEWMDKEEDHYHVLIRARVEPESPEDEKHEANRYRKKVAVTQFQISDHHQIHDLPNIEVLLAKTILQRLEYQANIIPVDASQYLLPKSTEHYLGTGISGGQIIVELAKSLGVQFVIAGRIMDMGVTHHPFGVQVRHVELEVKVYDGISGAIIARYNDNGSAWEGRFLDFPTTLPVLNDKFFAAPIGQETNRIINSLVTAVSDELTKMPFTARVVRAKGRKVHFDVGGLANVQVGDVLMAYLLDDEPLNDMLGKNYLGSLETPATSLIVKRVQPLFAIGELEVDTVRLKAGDVVRFTW